MDLLMIYISLCIWIDVHAVICVEVWGQVFSFHHVIRGIKFRLLVLSSFTCWVISIGSDVFAFTLTLFTKLQGSPYSAFTVHLLPSSCPFSLLMTLMTSEGNCSLEEGQCLRIPWLIPSGKLVPRGLGRKSLVAHTKAQKRDHFPQGFILAYLRNSLESRLCIYICGTRAGLLQTEVGLGEVLCLLRLDLIYEGSPAEETL